MTSSEPSQAGQASPPEPPPTTPYNFYNDSSVTSPAVAIALIALAGIFAVLVASMMVQLWPEDTNLPQAPSQIQPGETPSDAIGNSMNASLFGRGFHVSDEVRLFLLVLLGGALGGAIATVRDLVVAMGNANLQPKWLCWYVTEPLIGAGLGLAFYLVIRGGFFSPQATVNQTSPFTFVGVAVLVGLFTDQATNKLEEVAEAVFTEASKES